MYIITKIEKVYFAKVISSVSIIQRYIFRSSLDKFRKKSLTIHLRRLFFSFHKITTFVRFSLIQFNINANIIISQSMTKALLADSIFACTSIKYLCEMNKKKYCSALCVFSSSSDSIVMLSNQCILLRTAVVYLCKHCDHIYMSVERYSFSTFSFLLCWCMFSSSYFGIVNIPSIV